MKNLITILIALIASNFAANLQWSQLHKQWKFQPRIVDGENADIREVPWTLSLRRRGGHACGASLIKPDRALTAAHCYDPNEDEIGDFSVYAGSTYRIANGILVPVTKIYAHPKFNEAIMTYDIAVLWLQKKLTITEYIRPIALPKQGETFPKHSNLKGTIAGWGVSHDLNRLFEDLQKASLPIVSNDVCTKIFNETLIIEETFCAGFLEGGADACLGDSGGGFVFDRKIHGIISWGDDCAKLNHAGVYTRVSSFRNWIDSAITNDYSVNLWH